LAKLSGCAWFAQPKAKGKKQLVFSSTSI